MTKAKRKNRVFLPAGLNELLEIYRDHPTARLVAGNTGGLPEKSSLNSDIIYIGRPPELRQITRTESFIEIGATVTLSRILRIGGQTLAPFLRQAISSIANPLVRNQATIGGNISSKKRQMNLFPVLLPLNTRVEIRRHGKTRWLPLAALADPANALKPGELVSRARIYLFDWQAQHYARFGAELCGPQNCLTFGAVCNLQKGYLSNGLFIYGLIDCPAFRLTEVENFCEGRKIPLNEREIEQVRQILTKSLEENQPPLSGGQKRLILRSVFWFLKVLAFDRAYTEASSANQP